MDANREKYLADLADRYSVNEDAVFALAETLGEHEDHDGLLTIIEDFQFYPPFNLPNSHIQGTAMKTAKQPKSAKTAKNNSNNVPATEVIETPVTEVISEVPATETIAAEQPKQPAFPHEFIAHLAEDIAKIPDVKQRAEVIQKRVLSLSSGKAHALRKELNRLLTGETGDAGTPLLANLITNWLITNTALLPEIQPIPISISGKSVGEALKEEPKPAKEKTPKQTKESKPAVVRSSADVVKEQITLCLEGKGRAPRWGDVVAALAGLGISVDNPDINCPNPIFTKGEELFYDYGKESVGMNGKDRYRKFLTHVSTNVYA